MRERVKVLVFCDPRPLAAGQCSAQGVPHVHTIDGPVMVELPFEGKAEPPPAADPAPLIGDVSYSAGGTNESPPLAQNIRRMADESGATRERVTVATSGTVDRFDQCPGCRGWMTYRVDEHRVPRTMFCAWEHCGLWLKEGPVPSEPQPGIEAGRGEAVPVSERLDPEYCPVHNMPHGVLGPKCLQREPQASEPTRAECEYATCTHNLKVGCPYCDRIAALTAEVERLQGELAGLQKAARAVKLDLIVIATTSVESGIETLARTNVDRLEVALAPQEGAEKGTKG